MVQHGGIPRAHVYNMLASRDARVRRAAFILLEASNPRLRKSSELFIEIVRFIWDANPSYDVYREFSKRHLFQSPGTTKVVILMSAPKIGRMSKSDANADG